MKFKKCLNVFALAVCMVLALTALNSCKNNSTKPGGAGSANQALGSGSAGKVFTDSAASSVRVFDQNGRVCIQQTNTSYDVESVINGGRKIPVLLKIRKTELCYADSINHDKVFEITAKSITDTKPVDWAASFVATGINFKDNTLIAVKEGNDDEHDFIQRFSMLNGAEVFSCSFSDLEIKIPNVIDKFFIGFTSKKAATDPLSKLKTENLLGVVRLGSSSEAIDSFKVILKRSKVVGKLSGTAPDAVLVADNDNNRVIDDGKTIILMHADENYKLSDVTGFSVKFTFYYGDDNEATDISVPVVNAKLDLAHATYDKEIFELVAF